jgi:hypothetical protein
LKRGKDKRAGELAMGKSGLIARKCRCNKTWCRSCAVFNALKIFREQMAYFRITYTRIIVLTIDRALFDGPEEALDYCNKYLRQFFRDLQRKHGINIKRWVAVLEWHGDAFPHFHCFLEIDKRGRHGQIGWRIIRECWGVGSITEDYFKNKSHYDSYCGYFAKHGYFSKAKAHQCELPEMYRVSNRIIRRIRYSHMAGLVKKEDKETSCLFSRLRGRTERIRRTNGEALDSCGQSCKIRVFWDNEFTCEETINVPYDDIRKMEGTYKDYTGYVVLMSPSSLYEWLETNDPEKNLSSIMRDVIAYKRSGEGVTWQIKLN